MFLDGFEVERGDSVYDLYLGVGTVKQITGEDKIEVVFGRQHWTYDHRGVGRHGRRSLYWRNPILFTPAKDDEKWNLQVALSQAISNALRPGGGV